MTRVTIRLGNIGAVKKFSDTASRFDSEIDLLSGRYVINAKSMLGILSLDLGVPIQMQIRGEDCEDIIAAMQEFIVKEEI